MMGYGAPVKTAHRKRRLAGALRNRDGSAAVEFAIIAPVFLAMLFSIFEVGYYYFATSAVDAATARGARLVRTGIAQDTNLTKVDFFDHICKVVGALGDCNQRMTVEVNKYDTFSDLAADNAPPVCRDDVQTAINNIPYAIGAESEIVRIRVCYLHSVLNPGLGIKLGRATSGELKVVSAAIFRNEPFAKK